LFDEILGKPAHPLLIHAAVVFVPLLVGFALAYALVPFVRRFTWWIVIGLAVIAPFAAWFATISGNRLRTRLAAGGISPDVLRNIDVHRDWGDKTLWATVGLAVLSAALVALNMLRRPATGTGDGDAPGGTPAARSTGSMVLTIVVTVALVVFAGFSAYYVFKTGDSGAHTVWG